MTLAELTQALGGGGYTPKSEEEMEAQARRRYQGEYDARRLGARQTYEEGDAALSRQMAGLDQGYEDQMARLMRETDKSVRESGRGALMRGMQRSSYSAQTQAGIREAGLNGLAGLRQSLMDEKNALEERRALLARQLADKLAQYDVSYATDVQAYLDTLRDKEQERAREAKEYADKIAMALYEYGQKAAKGGRYYAGGSTKTRSAKKAKEETGQKTEAMGKGAGDSAVRAITRGGRAAVGAAGIIQRIGDALRGFSKGQ